MGIFWTKEICLFVQTVCLLGCRKTYLTILELEDHALFQKVRYVVLQPLRPELDGQDVEASYREDTPSSSR
jgi:hypothetical protein